jgi:hypothetical protein
MSGIMRALVLPLAIPALLVGACVVDSGPDAPEPPVVTSGTYHHYAQRLFTLPSNSSEARELGMDLDGDDLVDNQAGAVIGALSSLGLDVQTASDEALTDGGLVILHSVRADELAGDDSVSWRVMAGRPTEAPPRWDGTDSFRVATDDGNFVGMIDGRGADMAWGVIAVPLPFFPDQSPTILPLANAQIRANLTDSECDGRIAGAMLAADIDTTLRRFARQAITHIERHPEHELARVAHQVFDDNGDGVITVEEMVNDPITQGLFAPDLDLDHDGRADALSFGFGFSCEAAQFTAPNEF